MAKIYKRPNSPYWWCRYKTPPDGEEIRCSLKIPLGEEYRDIAQKKASKMEVDHWEAWKQGKLDRPAYTFEQLMVGWIEERKPGQASLDTIKALRTFFAGSVINNLTGKDIANCKRQWRHAGYSDNTIRRRLSTLSSAINYARREWEWDIDNPVQGRLPREVEFEADPLSYEEAQRFIDALYQRQFQPYNAPHLWDFFVLSVNTGLRKMELLSCRLNQVDLHHACIHLKSHQQKGRKRTATPLNAEALEALGRRLTYIHKRFPNTAWLFPSAKTKGEKHIKDVKTAFNTLRQEVGCPTVRVHDLRHTFASWLVQRGKTLYETSKALRHSSLKPTERYAHLELQHVRSTVAEIEDVPVAFNKPPAANDQASALSNWQRSLTGKFSREQSRVRSDSAHNSHINKKPTDAEDNVVGFLEAKSKA